MENQKENSSNYYIESLDIRIEDESTGEAYILTQQYDRGDCGFIQTEEPPTELPEKLENKIENIYDLIFNSFEQPPKPVLNCTGKWFQGDSEGEMNLDLSIEMGQISGNGEDRVGKFEIHGYLMDTHVTFKKSYINKHTLIYFGNSIANNNIYEGEWYLTSSGSKGRFELKIPISK